MRLLPALALLTAFAAPAQAQLRATDGLAALDAGDPAGAVAIWQPLAARGDVLAQFNLGVLAAQGQGGLTPAQADGFLQAAAGQGYLPALMLLADRAVDRQDWAMARATFAQAAAQGDGRAQFMAGWLADQGLGGARDEQAARALYEQAGAQGVVGEQLALGRLLVEQGDRAQARDWLQRAADAGARDAQFDLGVLLQTGAGADPVAARALYLRAARAGHTGAMRNLALMQARGQGGPSGFTTALAWALLAEADGAPSDTALVPALREVMSPQAQAEAQALAERCLTDPTAPCD